MLFKVISEVFVLLGTAGMGWDDFRTPREKSQDEAQNTAIHRD